MSEKYNQKISSNKPEKPKKKTIFTFSLTEQQMTKLNGICLCRGFDKYNVDYSNFAFKGESLNIVAYLSGNLVVQGKNAEDFVKFTIEPDITHEFTTGNEDIFHPEWFVPHAGLDESGKGDFFGPVVSACVIAGNREVNALQKLGIKDSKLISNDKKVIELDEKIRQIKGVVVEVMSVSMGKYNELYLKFGRNMNRLLGWMHFCSLKNALQKRYVPEGLLDQFSKEPIVQDFIKKEYPTFDLSMRTKAESDPVVAAASIVARAEYVRKMKFLSEDIGEILPKGAGTTVKAAGVEILKKIGPEGLAKYCKTHFKTYEEIIQKL